jgi:hypothetical protein
LVCAAIFDAGHSLMLLGCRPLRTAVLGNSCF